MVYTRKSWAAKYSTTSQEKVEITEKSFADVPAGSKMLIATPRIVDDYIRKIPKGRSGDLQQMRRDLAAEYHADYTCPITSGIFLRIVAEKAWEEYRSGKKPEEITPFWRMIDLDSPTASKLSFPVSFLLEQRNREGIESHLPRKRLQPRKK